MHVDRALFTSALDGIDDPIVVIAPEGQIQFRNRASRRLTPGLAAEGGIIASPTDEAAATQAFWQRCAEARRPLARVLTLRRRADEWERFLCYGSRIAGTASEALVLLRLSSPEAGSRKLGDTIELVRRELRERIDAQRQIARLLAEREQLLVSVQKDAAARERAEQDRDRIRARLYRSNQDERLRLAHDLHDQAGQQTAGLRLGLTSLRSKARSIEDAFQIDGLIKQVDAIGTELRRIAMELRPAALEDFGLGVAIRNLVEEWGEAHRLPVAMQVVGNGRELTSQQQVTLFRLTQEALTNVSKHAPTATTVSIVLRYETSAVVLTISDDGPGIEIADGFMRRCMEASHFGIAGMRERLLLVGGEFQIESAPGAGTTIFARIEQTEVAA